MTTKILTAVMAAGIRLRNSTRLDTAQLRFHNANTRNAEKAIGIYMRGLISVRTQYSKLTSKDKPWKEHDHIEGNDRSVASAFIVTS